MSQILAMGHILLLSSLHIAGPGQGADQIQLRSGSVEPSMMGHETAEMTQAGIFLVRSPREAGLTRRGLEAAGFDILTYLPEGAFLVRGAGASLMALQSPLALDHIGTWSPKLKMAPELKAANKDAKGGGIIVHVFPGEDIQPVVDRAKALGFEVTTTTRPRFARVVLQGGDAGDYGELAAMESVFYVERRGEVRLLNAQAVPMLQSGDNSGATPIHDRGLLGQGQVVGYIDTGLDFDNCFFRDEDREPVINTNGGTEIGLEHRKVQAYDLLWSSDDPSNDGDFDNHGHGTHVGGNIGGMVIGATESTQNGMAPAARFVVQDGGYGGVDDCADLAGLGCPVVDLVPFFEQAYVQGARVHNNSWGDNENSSAQWTYSVGSQDVDEVVRAHRDMLIIFAAGNSGPGAGSVGSPSTGKNVLAVGGSGNGATLERVVSFSSRGPTEDGRLKPEVMAPASNTSAGSDRDVASDNCDLNTGSGTSYAAPLVAGAAALLRQYFEEGYYPSGAASLRDGFSPSASLLKGGLVASGRSMARASAIPSMDQGFGRIALEDVMSFEDSAFSLRIVDESVVFTSAQDDPYTLDITVASNKEALKVVLTWTDPPSNPVAAKNLVNDLDLTVSSASKTFRGNVMRMGRSVPGGDADRLNNLEVVYLPSPKAGRYSVVVDPSSLPDGVQNFSLVVRGDLTE